MRPSLLVSEPFPLVLTRSLGLAAGRAEAPATAVSATVTRPRTISRRGRALRIGSPPDHPKCCLLNDESQRAEGEPPETRLGQSRVNSPPTPRQAFIAGYE